MKHEGQERKKVNRFGRPQKSRGIYADGLSLEGVSSKFGFMGIGLLILVGIAILLVTHIPKEKELVAINIDLQAPPYRTPKLKNAVLLPITGARVLALDPAAFAAADTIQIFALTKGETLKAYLIATDATNWNDGVGRKDFYKALLLQKTDNSWLVDYKAYRKKAVGFSSQGWWLILLGVILVPYQIIQSPKFSIWFALLLYGLVLVGWYFFM